MADVPSTPSPTDLVERDVEWSRLTTLVDRAFQGRGGSAHVLGEPGIGKTALVRALADHARSRGASVWFGSASELETRSPFGTLRRLLDTPVRALSAQQHAQLAAGPGRLALSSLWQRTHPVGANLPTQADMLHSVGWLTGELVGASPTVLVIDDVQWADEESLLFLGWLRERLTEMPLIVVTTMRDVVLSQAPSLAALISDRDAAVLRPDPLSVSGIDTVLGGMGAQASPGAAATLREVTNGNPFLVHALSAALRAESPAPLSPGRIRSAVPDSILTFMLSRMANLTPTEQRLAQATAVLDSATFPVAVATARIDLSDNPAQAADSLRSVGLFASGQGLRFRHALLRSAVYSSIGIDTRESLHRSAATVLGKSGDWARAAAHLLSCEGAGDEFAVRVLREASRQAEALGAPETVVLLLQRAVAEPPEPSVLPEVLLELGTAQLRMLDMACIETLQCGADLVVTPQEKAPFVLAIANALSYAGEHLRAARVLGELLESLPVSDRDLAMTVEAAWIAVGLLIPEYAPSVLARLRAHQGLTGATVGERLVLIQQVSASVYANEPAHVTESYANRVIGDWDTAEQFPETGDWVWPRLFLGRIGQFDRVRRLADEAYVRAEQRGSVLGMVASAFVRAFTDADAGELRSAEEHYVLMRKVDAAPGQSRSLLMDILSRGGLAQVLALQGRAPEALAALGPFDGGLPPDAPVDGIAVLEVGRGTTALSIGDYNGALAAAKQINRLGASVGVDSPLWFGWRVLAVRALRGLNRLEEAGILAREHLELCEQNGASHLYAEALSIAASVMDDEERAVAQAREAVALLAGSGARLREGHANLTLGTLLRRAGHRSLARAPLRVARDILASCGAAPAAEFAAAELAATGAHAGRGDLTRLTPSQQRVAELVLAELSNTAIAAQLQVSRKTVETHLSAIYRKLGISSRHQLTPAHVGIR
ncbi:LuxR family transcriptional regulator [Rarobacter faecitabidus]|uniref:Regulatory LuxR family protein n=1 Tax=Rarobacter faecitabidus TaxID=13243 RepID=A0A542ZEE8_RARFA|nr:LuxR family transcriptional regulator [Rarobacter faecitabidus]TQL58659.1 regulatory LuxR family protein [Rarobacter faecitabidus]